MKTTILSIAFILMASFVFASEIIPPDMRVPQLVKTARTKYVTELWGVDYKLILKADKNMTPRRVWELLNSIDPDKIKLAKHKHLATVITMLEPKEITFTFEARETGSTKVPTAYYLIKLEEKKSNTSVHASAHRASAMSTA